MRILQVNKFLYRKGGAEAYMLDLGQALSDDGHSVEYWGMRSSADPSYTYGPLFMPEANFDDPPDSSWRRAQMAGRLLYSTGARRLLRQVMDDFEPDVVHLHNIYHQLSPSVLAAADRRGVGVVMTLHDYKLACPAYRFLNSGGICEACGSGKWYEATLRKCTRDALLPSALNSIEAYLHQWLGLYSRHVDVFISPSHFLAERMLRVGIDPNKLQVIHNFADTAAVEPSSGGSGIIYVGRLSDEKGVATLIRATASANSKAPAGGSAGPMTLTIYGSGPQEAQLRSLAGDLDSSNIHFAGSVDKARVTDAMASALAVVVPSEWYENCPMTVLEAFAVGTPVVASNLGGMPELVDDGVTGLLYQAGDEQALSKALRSLVSDPVAAGRLGQNARKKAESDFALDQHLRQVTALYDGARGVLRRSESNFDSVRTGEL